MDNQLIFEIGTEEIPAGYLIPALNKLKKNMSSSLKELQLDFSKIKGAATPRRLVLCIENLANRQPDRTEEILGPPKKAAFDANDKPTKAAEGFAKSKGARLEDIQIIQTPKGEYLMIVQESKGQNTSDLLSELLPEQIKNIPFPKSMRWGSSRTSFARPIQWLTAIYNGEIVPFSLDGAGDSSDLTYGHRFMSPGAFKVQNYNQYTEELRRCHVLIDMQERKQALLTEINRVAKEAGGFILQDDELVETVVNLVESPYAICGSFDRKFLELPRNALITSMREHQKYFAVVDDKGNLMPNFIAVNNTKVKDLNLAAEGHQRVLRARLEDGLFFFRDDQTKKLADRVNDLNGIVFQAKLGSMAEKTERVTNLAKFLATKLAPGETETIARAAHLAKADLLTEMVNEFTSLQGSMGHDYALLDGETTEVATAIQEHYMPVRAGSPLPKSVAGSIISMADRIDTIVGCFGIGQVPTGTTDPFGLRRLALGLIHLIEDNKFILSLSELCDEAIKQYNTKLTEEPRAAKDGSIGYIKGRFTNDQSTTTSAEAVSAAVSTSFDDIVDCIQRINALVEISNQPSFAMLAASFKRVMNIIKNHQAADISPSLFEEDAEIKLHETYQKVNTQVQPLINQRQYLPALDVILEIKDDVDLFFDKVMVMSDKPDVKENRLNLLSAIANMFLQVGDFSRMNK